jgi:hypothetical protein
MFKSRRLLVVAVALAFSVIAAPAFAGGGGGSGGTKRNGTIKFVNVTSDTLAVTTNSNSAAIQAALNGVATDTSESQFLSAWTAAGGKIIGPNASYSFSVSAGTYSLGVGDVTAIEANGVVDGTNVITENVTVSKGQTVTVYVTSPSSGTISF